MPPPPERDLYEILGVARGASEDEIRSAYRALARKHHPDVSTDTDAEARFAEIQEAYAVLSDDQKRAAYDRFGQAGAAQGFGGQHPAGGHSVDPSQFNDIFEQMFSGGGFGGAGPRQAHRPAARRGVDVTKSVTVTFMTAATGGSERIDLDDGSSVDLTIPAGIEDGTKLRIRGKGGHGTDGGASGDVIVKVAVGGHPRFKRRGLDLIVDVPVTISEASLGTTVRIALLTGSIDLQVPAGTSSGKTLRVPGQGITAQDRTGDLRAVVQIVAPVGLTDEQEHMLEQLGETLPDPRADLDGVDSAGGVF